MSTGRHSRQAAKPTPSSPTGSRRYAWRLAVAFGVLALLAAVGWWLATDGTKPGPRGDTASAPAPTADGGAGPSSGPAAPPPAGLPAARVARYVGSAACVDCHAAEHARWLGSQHALSMLEASEKSVLGDFVDARFAHQGFTSRFFRRDGRYFVNTEGPDGKAADFEIKYTFGVYPLQQYLIELSGGRLQALGIAWDSREATQGGQRWFHLYPDRTLQAGEPLHWTGIDQNWNYQCADCHSTDLRKNFDSAANAFRTRWSEVNVGCEACHGPASNHVDWAKKQEGWQRYDGAGKGLTAVLDERHGVSWAIDATTGNAARSRPRTTDREIEVCARCHARRGQFSDQHIAGQPLHDAFRPALLEPGLYFPDGQQRDEVYKYASFLQSRMHVAGVTCSDCHDPHGQKLIVPGNAVCAQCHAPARYDAIEHHRHAPGSTGARCAGCHMPPTTYMVVDPRHDHSFRIPRPDRSLTLDTPNACNRCHVDKTGQWAADAVKRWYPDPRPGLQTFAEAFHAGERGAPGARGELMSIAADRRQPAIVRASAVLRLGAHLDPSALAAAASALNDQDANVRMAAVGVLGNTDAATRARHLPRMLDDVSRVVRMDAARGIAGEPERRLTPAERAKFEAALADYTAAQRFNADRPEGHANLGALHAARGQFDEASSSFRKAIEIDPTFVLAAVNLADLNRAAGRDDEAVKVLESSLQTNPASAPLHFALGLTRVRQGNLPEALAALGQAAKLEPEAPRFAYVYAVALHDSGRRADALAVLESALSRHPFDREILIALASYEREAGDLSGARARIELLRRLEPGDPTIEQLLR